jgi:hypothetical protein
MSVVTGTRKKGISDAGDDKEIRRNLSRNIWAIIFILPSEMLHHVDSLPKQHNRKK